VLEQVLEEAVVPLRRVVGPDTFEAAGDGDAVVAVLVAVLPTQALLLDGRALGLRADVLRAHRAVGLAERMPTDDERRGLLVIHRHTAEGFADVLRGQRRVGVAAGTFGVDVDEAHVVGAERALELSVGGVALVTQPGVLRSPEDLVGLPDVRATEAEAEGL